MRTSGTGGRETMMGSLAEGLGTLHVLPVVGLRPVAVERDGERGAASANMEPHDPIARVRERRFRALVDELLPKLRRLNPQWSDEEILDTAESMAELRLLDEEMG
jgi:hypothetical protein